MDDIRVLTPISADRWVRRLLGPLLITAWLVAAVMSPSDTRAASDSQCRFVTGCWSAPRNLDVPYMQWLKDHGFTHALYWRSPAIDAGRWAADLAAAEQLGIRLVFDSWQPAAAPDAWVDAVLEAAGSSPAFAGIYAPDEPGYRWPLEGQNRKPSEAAFASTFTKVSARGRTVFCCDAVSAAEKHVARFLPFCSVFGMDVYPYRHPLQPGGRASWTGRVEQATRAAIRLAEGKQVWMVLQGHGRQDWYRYATDHLGLQIPPETGERPSPEILLDMARAARETGASGVWWWSFELYDWQQPDHRAFVESFKETNLTLRKEVCETK